MSIDGHDKDDVIVLKGRIFKIKIKQMPPNLPYLHNDMYDLRYKKEGENILHIYITCNVGIIDDSKIQDYFNEILGKPSFECRVTDIISCSYHEEYTWVSSSDEDDSD